MKLIISAVLILAGIRVFGATLTTFACSIPQPPAAYVKMKSDRDKSIEQFSNSKTIATAGDALLSKLLAAKSPVIMNWLSKRNLKDKNEDEIIKAWRLYYAQNFVLIKYPQEKAADNLEVEKLVDQALTKHLNKDFKNRMNKLFTKVKKAALKTLATYELPHAAAITQRVEAINLYFPKDLKSARNNSAPLDIISWGIAYDPIPNEINVGLEALAYADDDTYLAVFAHEIGHSFDPCRWGAFFEGKWPFEKVGECLRTSDSAAAKKRDDSKLEEFQASGKISADLAAGLKANPTCNKLVYPPVGIQSDQLPETFADWFSAEVIAHLEDVNVAQFRNDLCETKELSEGSSYPENRSRLEKIYFLQPKIKARLKSGESFTGKYCALKGSG